LDRKVLPADTPQTAVIKITLDAPPPDQKVERPPVNLGIVLDRSGSMSGNKIKKAREAALEALRRLNRNDIFSLVVYDHEVDSLIPAQSAGLTEWMESRIHGIQSRGNTALFGGVSQGAAELRMNITKPYIHRLILLSDGLANVGPSSPGDLARLGAGLLKEGISVTTVGVGTDFNEDLMTQMAEASDGNHYFVESSVDLPRIFARELGDVLSVAARQILVEITCPAGVRPVRIIGRDGQIKGDTVQLYMNQLYGGQEKYALVEVEVPAGSDGSIMEIASARCSYENAFSQRKEQASGSVNASFSGRAQEVKDSANVGIQKEIIANEIAVIQDFALDCYNAGDNVQAGVVLREKKAELEARNSILGLSVLNEETQRLDMDAEGFEQNKVDNVGKKRIRASSYKTRSQQQ
jgi:Ca-activated chloride channel family protein